MKTPAQREAIRANHKRWRQANPDKVRAYNRKWKKSPNGIASRARWVARNRDWLRRYMRAYMRFNSWRRTMHQLRVLKPEDSLFKVFSPLGSWEHSVASPAPNPREALMLKEEALAA